MATKEDKRQFLLDDLIQIRQSIVEIARSLSPDMRYQVFLGVWTPEDLIAHLIGWDETNKEAIINILAGDVPAFYEHYDRDWKTYNAQLVSRYKKEDFEALLSSVEASHIRLIDLIQSLPSDVLTKDFGVRVSRYKVTIERLLGAELDDEKVHLEQIRDFANSHRIN